SQCITHTYNWSIPNRRDYEKRIRLRVYDNTEEETRGMAGYFNYGHTLYLNIDLHSNYRDLTHTLFHEFFHWNQFWIDERPPNRMTNVYSDKVWDYENAEDEAEEWALIGHFTFDTYLNMMKSREIHNDIRGIK
ncbi:MAG TPA: hypothetical protein DCX27_19630, partial [Balneola sp.]|nr:hypothetical protein [Balneola sp.]